MIGQVLRRFSTVAIAVVLSTPLFAGAASAASEGPFVIRNTAVGLCIDIPGYDSGTVDGPVSVYHCDSSKADNQRFMLQSTTGRYFLIRNVKDGLCLDLPNYGAVDAGTRVSEYHCQPGLDDNQEFSWGSKRWGTGRQLIHRQTGLCLDVEGYASGGPDTRVGLFYCNDNGSADDHFWVAEYAR